jgi:hypothetical protein
MGREVGDDDGDGGDDDGLADVGFGVGVAVVGLGLGFDDGAVCVGLGAEGSTVGLNGRGVTTGMVEAAGTGVLPVEAGAELEALPRPLGWADEGAVPLGWESGA